MKNLLILLTIIFSTQIFAQTRTKSLIPPLCRELFYKGHDVPIGFTCLADKFGDLVYERVERAGFGIAWKDSTGLIWSDLQEYLNGEKIQFFDDAWVRCESLGAHLPLVSEYHVLRDLKDHGGYPPMYWANLPYGETFSSVVVSLPRVPYAVNTGTSPNYYGGMANRQDRNAISTVCVDDSEVSKKPSRPVRPDPIQ